MTDRTQASTATVAPDSDRPTTTAPPLAAMAEAPRVRMTGRGAAIVVGLIIGGLVLFGVAESTGAEVVGTVGVLLWLAALLGVAIAAWLTQFEVVEPDE